MDVMEKLVELLDIIIQPGQKTLGNIADYLIRQSGINWKLRNKGYKKIIKSC